MADPHSTTAKIADLLLLVTRILATGCTFQKGPLGLQQLLSEISRLNDVLSQINELIHYNASSVVQLQSSKERISEAITLDTLETASNLLKSVHSSITLCNQIPGQRKKKVGQAIVWPFQEREVRKNLDGFRRLINTFELALRIESSHQVCNVNNRTSVILDEHQEERVHKLLKVLSTLDPPKRHQGLQARRYKGSVLRLLEYEHFRVWQDSSIGIENTSNRILQCYGIPGAGKTIVSSMVIDHLLSHYGEQRVAYIYCDYRDKTDQNLLNIMGSILKQHLAAATHIPKAILDLLESFQEQGSKVAIKDVSKMLKVAILQTTSHFLCIDAVDELEPGVRLELLNALQTEFGSTRIFLTGRPHITSDVSRILQICSANAIQITPNPTEVREYLSHEIDLDWEMSTDDMNEQLKGEILDGIVSRAEGMFLLPVLHISMILEQPTMAKRRRALSTLPSELNHAYTRMVDKIQYSSSLSYLGMRVLMWLHLATRPLKLNEIQHALAVDCGDIAFDKEAIPTKKRLLDCCLGLVLVDEETSTIRLMHYTLEEYFRKHSSTTFPHGHYTAAEMCLTYLNLGELGVECKSHIDMMQLLEKFPFLEYASLNWGHYTALAQEGLRALAMKVVLSKQRRLPHIALQILYWGIQGSLPWCRFWYDYHGASIKVWGIHAAAYFGLETYISMLGNTQGWDNKGANGRSPLSFAALGGQEAVVRLLIEQADVDADSKDAQRRTPLSWAAEGGYEVLVRLLVEQEDVDADSQDVNYRRPLSWAAQRGHEAVVRLLVERADVDADSTDLDARTPLSWAAEGGHEAVVRLLVERADVNADSMDGSGRTPLSWAARRGHEAVVRLLGERADVNADAKDWRDQTPLSLAALGGHGGVVRHVERMDVGANSKDNYGQSLVSLAAEGGPEAVVRLLLQRAGMGSNAKDILGMTPLSWAAERGYEAVVQLLVAREGVDADSLDGVGRTPLSWAARRGHEAVVRLLVEREDVNADSKDLDARTPLSWAAEGGHEAVVRLLGERADVNADSMDGSGQTPLSWAARRGHEAVVRLLVGREDVDLDSKDGSDRTPLSWAAEAGCGAAVRLLVERAAVDADSMDDVGQTPLSWAARGGHEAVVRLLGERADVNADSMDDSGQTPLSWAAEAGHEAVVRELVERADVDADSMDDVGQTPLSWAARRGHEAVVRLLIERADVGADSIDDNGQTPLSLAAEGGHEAVVRLLVERADVNADSMDGSGRTPLSWAAGGGHEAVVRLLVEQEDVDPGSKDGSDRTPLSWAAEAGNDAVVQLLLVRA